MSHAWWCCVLINRCQKAVHESIPFRRIMIKRKNRIARTCSRLPGRFCLFHVDWNLRIPFTKASLSVHIIIPMTCSSQRVVLHFVLPVDYTKEAWLSWCGKTKGPSTDFHHHWPLDQKYIYICGYELIQGLLVQHLEETFPSILQGQEENYGMYTRFFLCW